MDLTKKNLEKYLEHSHKGDNPEFVQEYNKALVAEYPFLKPNGYFYYSWDVNAGPEEYKYDLTWLDDMPDGWRLAFGMDMMADLKFTLEQYRCMDKFVVEQVKEKYGSLRWYSTLPCEEVAHIINKYENLSYRICITCGKPAMYQSTGWICPYCKHCAESLFNGNYKKFYSSDIKFDDCFKKFD